MIDDPLPERLGGSKDADVGALIKGLCPIGMQFAGPKPDSKDEAAESDVKCNTAHRRHHLI
jgi:hypothetical protein